jgi:hypothetical protein
LIEEGNFLLGRDVIAIRGSAFGEGLGNFFLLFYRGLAGFGGGAGVCRERERLIIKAEAVLLSRLDVVCKIRMHGLVVEVIAMNRWVVLLAVTQKFIRVYFLKGKRTLLHQYSL